MHIHTLSFLLDQWDGPADAAVCHQAQLPQFDLQAHTPEGYCDLHVYCILHAPAQVDEQVNIHTEKNLKVEGEWEYTAQ